MSNLSRSTSLNDISPQEEDGILDATTMTDGIDNSGSQSGQYICYVYILLMEIKYIISIDAAIHLSYNLVKVLWPRLLLLHTISSDITQALTAHFDFTSFSSFFAAVFHTYVP